MNQEDKLYSDIEEAVIRWNIDGTKTAGHLTRKIIVITQKNRGMKKKELRYYTMGFLFGILFGVVVCFLLSH